MSTIIDSKEPVADPVQVDLEIAYIGNQMDTLLDGEMDDSALRRLSHMSSRKKALEGLHTTTPWTRFYRDSHGQIHAGKECYAAAHGSVSALPEMSGKGVPAVVYEYGQGRVCKMCTRGLA